VHERPSIHETMIDEISVALFFLEWQMLSWSLVPADIDNLGLFLAVGSVAAMLFSMAKAGFGGSVGLLAVPLMIFACGGNSKLAIGIMLPILIAADYVAFAAWIGKWNLRAVRMLLPGAAAGIAAGWAVLHALNSLGGTRPEGGAVANAWLKVGVGAIALAFVALHVVRSLRGRPLTFRPVPWQATVAGAAAGASSTLAHAAGPVIAMYLLPQRMPKGQYVASTALFFWIANQTKLIPYFAEGMINTSTLGAGLLLVPAIAAGGLLGKLLHNRVNQAQFNGIVYGLLAIAGGWLVWQGAAGLVQ